MSRKATTHDNIMIEIFFGRMKVEMFYGKEKTFKDLNDLEKDNMKRPPRMNANRGFTV